MLDGLSENQKPAVAEETQILWGRGREGKGEEGKEGEGKGREGKARQCLCRPLSSSSAAPTWPRTWGTMPSAGNSLPKGSLLAAEPLSLCLPQRVWWCGGGIPGPWSLVRHYWTTRHQPVWTQGHALFRLSTQGAPVSRGPYIVLLDGQECGLGHYWTALDGHVTVAPGSTLRHRSAGTRVSLCGHQLLFVEHGLDQETEVETAAHPIPASVPATPGGVV